MHQIRNTTTKKLPIPRKGSKYVAVASSHKQESVPLVIAIRDMLGLAKTAAEVKKMIRDKLLKINGKEAKDHRESIRLFNILEAGKKYELIYLKTKKFALTETKRGDTRLAKVINKKLLKKGVIQLNLHDGTNINSKEKINVGDSIEVDFKGKIKEKIPLTKGAKVFILKGKYLGHVGKIEAIEGSKVSVKLEEKTAEIKLINIIVTK